MFQYMLMCGISASVYSCQVGYLRYVKVSCASPPFCTGGRVLFSICSIKFKNGRRELPPTLNGYQEFFVVKPELMLIPIQLIIIIYYMP